MIILTEKNERLKGHGAELYRRSDTVIDLDAYPYDEKKVKALAANKDRTWADEIDRDLAKWDVKIDRSRPHELIIMDPETGQYGVRLSVVKI